MFFVLFAAALVVAFVAGGITVLAGALRVIRVI